MSVCRYCGKPISWIQLLKSGAKLPVEGDVISYNDLTRGDIIITDGGVVYKKEDWRSLPNVKGRIHHFSVCPEMKDWQHGKA